MKIKMKKIAIGLSITLNVIILAIVILVWSGSALNLLIGLFALPSHERWVSQFEVIRVKPGDTVFLGDSITEGGSWHELFPQSNVRNRGIGGDVTTGVIARLNQITDGQPAQIFLMVGTNDLFGGVSQTDIVANIIRIIEEVHDASPQTDLFVQSILPRSESYQESIESLNSALETAIVGKATWVNLYPLFLDEAGTSIDDSLSNDELHLLGQGYIVWRDAIVHLLNRSS